MMKYMMMYLNEDELWIYDADKPWCRMVMINHDVEWWWIDVELYYMCGMWTFLAFIKSKSFVENNDVEDVDWCGVWIKLSML
jgi:hypothetical protein